MSPERLHSGCLSLDCTHWFFPTKTTTISFGGEPELEQLSRKVTSSLFTVNYDVQPPKEVGIVTCSVLRDRLSIVVCDRHKTRIGRRLHMTIILSIAEPRDAYKCSES